MADNPLVGRFDSGSLALVEGMLRQAIRPIRIRLINSIGADIPLELGDCTFVQLQALHDRLLEEQVRLLCRVRMAPSNVPMLFGLDTTLLSRMIGMLMGEDPWAEPAPVDHRPLTGADIRLARRVLEDLVAGLEQGLPKLAAQTLTIEEVTDEPRLDLGLPGSAGIFETSIAVGDPENPLGTAVLAMPTSVVPTFFPELSETRAPGNKKAGVARVLPIQVDAVAELARVKVPLSRVHELTVGDTLPLGRIRQVNVRVRDKVALIAEPGVMDGSRCVRVLRNVHDLDKAAS